MGGQPGPQPGKAKAEMFVLDVGDAPRSLRAAVLAMKAADKGMKKRINDAMSAEFNPVWKRELAQNLGGFSRADDMMLRGARLRRGNPPALVAATSRARYGRALIPMRDWHLAEYGVSDHYKHAYTRRSRKGRTHNVSRDVSTGWPARSQKGRIAGPAARAILPRVASFWIQSIIKTWIEAAEKGMK